MYCFISKPFFLNYLWSGTRNFWECILFYIHLAYRIISFFFSFFFFWDNKFIIVIFQTIWVYLQAEKVIHQYEIAENSIKYHHENTSIEQGIQFRDIESRGFHWFCLQQQHLSSNHNSGIYRLYANAGFMEFHERWNCLMGVQLLVRQRGSREKGPILKLPASIYSPYRKDRC